jgi:hypothetical protein
MKRLLAAVLLIAAPALADLDQPPYEVQDSGVNQNFQTIYRAVDSLGQKFTTDILTANVIMAAPFDPAPRTNITPSQAGCIIRDSTANVMCWSTGTAVNSWVLFTSTSTPCPN